MQRQLSTQVEIDALIVSAILPNALLAAAAKRHLVTSGHLGSVVIGLASLQVVRHR